MALYLKRAGHRVTNIERFEEPKPVGSGLILLLEIPVAQRLRRRSSYPIIATGYLLVGAGFALFGLPVSATYCHEGRSMAGLFGWRIELMSSDVPPLGGVQSSQPTLPGPARQDSCRRCWGRPP